MAAGLGFKDFTTGEVLTANDVDGYLMQGIWVFASAAARDAAVTSPQEGNFAYLKDTNVTTYYTGSAWTNLDTTGMVNPMTTTGDTIYSSSGSTPARLGIGSTGQVLTVAGGLPSWATPAGGGSGLTKITSSSFSASSAVNVNDVFSATYKNYKVMLNITSSAAGINCNFRYRVGGADNSTANYATQLLNATGASVAAGNVSGQTSGFLIDIKNVNANQELTFFNPFASELTYSTAVGNWEASAPILQQRFGGFNATTSFTGFTIIPASGTITGSLIVYGLAD